MLLHSEITAISLYAPRQLRRLFIHLENTRVDIAPTAAADVVAPALSGGAIDKDINRAGCFRLGIAQDQIVSAQ